MSSTPGSSSSATPVGAGVAVCPANPLEFPAKEESAREPPQSKEKVLGEALSSSKVLGDAPSAYKGCFSAAFSGAAAEHKSLPNVDIDVVTLQSGKGTISRATFKAGWNWRNDIKPRAKTEWCEHEHYGFVLSGSMVVRMSDGTQKSFRAGDAFYIPPHHDGWTDEGAVLIDSNMARYGEQHEACTVDHHSELVKMGLQIKSFDKPDITRSMPLAQVQILKFGEKASIARLTVQPGWKWSTHVKPIVGTDLCQHSHIGVTSQGRHRITMADGTTIVADPSQGVQYFEAEPGHDGELLGDEEGVLYDITPMIRHYGDRN